MSMRIENLCFAEKEIVGFAVLGVLGLAVQGNLGWTAPLASFVVDRFVGCTIAMCVHALVAVDHALGSPHTDTVVHSLHCSRAQYGMAPKTGPACFPFRFSPQEVLLCRLPWTKHTRNKPHHKATNSA